MNAVYYSQYSQYFAYEQTFVPNLLTRVKPTDETGEFSSGFFGGFLSDLDKNRGLELMILWRQSVVNHGEVFTAEHEVIAMQGLLKQET